MRKFGAKNIILNLDSYGGLVTAGEEISRYIKRQSDLHTIAFVQDKAISAGAMIAMACDEIVMSNSATLGDCAAIVFGPTGLETMARRSGRRPNQPSFWILTKVPRAITAIRCWPRRWWM